MDFSWDDSHNELYQRIVNFGRDRLSRPAQANREATPAFNRDIWRACGEFGLLGLCVPEQYNGMGLNALGTARMVEGFGLGCDDLGLVFAASAHLFACVVPILEFGGDKLKAELLPGLARGTLIGANAITEAEAGSDVFALKTRAVRDGDHYVLSGTKSYVTNGPVADVILVYAVTNPKHGYMGLSAFIVDRNTPGLSVGKPFEKVGLTTALTSSVYLQECHVPASRLLGDEGQGAPMFKVSMLWERACLFAMYVGAMERQLNRCVMYAKERNQFGKAIGSFQAISHRIADMKLRLEAARLLLYRACWLRDQGEHATLDIALAKVAISEAAVQIGLDAIQIFGGNGIICDYDVERALRDALPATIFSGTSEIQRNLIAQEMGV